MSYLTLDADRLVRDAVDAFMAGRLRPDPLPDTVYATKNSRYRIIAGIVHEASDTSLMGAELVGWLLEEAGSARIEPRWRTSSRGVFVERKSGHAVVTSRVLTRSVVSESGRPRLGLGASTIPPAPPIPQLKQAPSIAPPELVSLGQPDPLPVRPASRPSIPDDEVTKVERTEIADADELQALRETSAHSIPPPPMLPSDGPPPSRPVPDDLDAPTRPVFSAADARSAIDGAPAQKAPPSRPTGPRPSPSRPTGSRPSPSRPSSMDGAPSQPSTSRGSQPPPRLTPKLVAPRMPSSRPPPPRPSSRRRGPAVAAPSAKKPPPPPPSKKAGVPPPPKSSQKPLPPPNPPPRKSR